jgi:hypothetical protein
LRVLPAVDPHYVEQVERSRNESDEFLHSSKCPLFLGSITPSHFGALSCKTICDRGSLPISDPKNGG